MRTQTRRTILIGALGAALAGPAFAQADYPNRAIRVIVPFAPGGGTDNLVRLIEPKASAALGNKLVIENRGGAAGMIGSEAVARSDPDGYTILITDASFVLNPAVQPKMPYDSLKDFVPVIALATGSSVLLVHPSVPAKNLKEFIALAKTKEISVANAGAGTGPHLAAELLRTKAGIKLVHVPYKGTGPATTDTVAGHVPATFNGASAVKPHVDAGRLRALAVTGDKRNPAFPDVPTFGEEGYPGFPAASLWGVYVPTGTPMAVIEKLETAFRKAVLDPELAPRLAHLGFTPMGEGPVPFKKRVISETETWIKVAKDANIVAN